MKIKSITFDGHAGEVRLTRSRNGISVEQQRVANPQVFDLVTTLENDHDKLQDQVWYQVAPLIYGQDRRSPKHPACSSSEGRELSDFIGYMLLN